MTTSAEVLRRARERAGLTQSELADRSGVSQSSISAYERAHHVPSVETLQTLVQATGHVLSLDLREILQARPSTLETLRDHRAELLTAGLPFGVTGIRVFGSVARGEDGPGSDVDLLIDLETPVGLLGLSRIEDALSEVAGRRVEVVPTYLLTEGSKALLESSVPL